MCVRQHINKFHQHQSTQHCSLLDNRPNLVVDTIYLVMALKQTPLVGIETTDVDIGMNMLANKILKKFVWIDLTTLTLTLTVSQLESQTCLASDVHRSFSEVGHHSEGHGSEHQLNHINIEEEVW